MVLDHLQELYEKGMIRIRFPVLKSITMISTWPSGYQKRDISTQLGLLCA
jgi:hypothetical protein